MENMDATAASAKRKERQDSGNGDQEIGRQAKYTVSTRNRYHVLTDTEPDTDDDEQDVTSSRYTRTKTTDTTKTLPPPPITLHDKHEHKPLTALICQAVKDTFNIKYTRDGTTIYTNNMDDRNSLMQKFKENNFNFHTYTDKNIKTTSYVIRGFSNQTTTADITNELTKQHKVPVLRCAAMRTKSQPLYLVTVPQEVTFGRIKTITGLDHTKVVWEKYTTQRRITQCHRCQMWGHATSNCHAAPKCLKCAQSHQTQECKKSPEEPAKCINCDGDHPASAPICPMFIRRKKWLDERAQARRPHQAAEAPQPAPAPARKFAPAPAINPWTRTAASTSATPHQSPPPRTEPPRTPASSGSFNDFNELQTEIQTLNQLVNLREMLEKIKKLNTKLAAVRTPRDRMQIAILFFSGLDD